MASLLQAKRPRLDRRNTEELGKAAEKAVCNVFRTAFSGKYKYELTLPTNLEVRFEKLRDIFAYNNIRHTASNGNRYDITATDENGDTKYLSIKSSKSTSAKVCPQVIGQPCHNVFCDYFQLPRSSNASDIKAFIIENINTILSDYFKHTFDCDIFYYNEPKDKCLYIKTIKDIEWRDCRFKFTRNLDTWNESTTLHILTPKPVTIGEFQIHNNRDGIKFRWNFEKVLNVFKDSFDIKEL